MKTVTNRTLTEAYHLPLYDVYAALCCAQTVNTGKPRMYEAGKARAALAEFYTRKRDRLVARAAELDALIRLIETTEPVQDEDRETGDAGNGLPRRRHAAPRNDGGGAADV